jgi:hypothetical protein
LLRRVRAVAIDKEITVDDGSTMARAIADQLRRRSRCYSTTATGKGRRWWTGFRWRPAMSDRRMPTGQSPDYIKLLQPILDDWPTRYSVSTTPLTRAPYPVFPHQLDHYEAVEPVHRLELSDIETAIRSSGELFFRSSI